MIDNYLQSPSYYIWIIHRWKYSSRDEKIKCPNIKDKLCYMHENDSYDARGPLQFANAWVDIDVILLIITIWIRYIGCPLRIFLNIIKRVYLGIVFKEIKRKDIG